MSRIVRAGGVVRRRGFSIHAVAVNVGLLSYTASSLSRLYRGVCGGVAHLTGSLIGANRSVSGRCNIPVMGGHVSVAPVTLMNNSTYGAASSCIGVTGALSGYTGRLNIGFLNKCSTVIDGNVDGDSRLLVHSVPRTVTRASFVYDSMGMNSAGANVGVSTMHLLNRVVGSATRTAGSGNSLNYTGLIILYGTPSSGPFVTNTFRNISRTSTIMDMNIDNPNIMGCTLRRIGNRDFRILYRAVGHATFGVAHMNRLITGRTSHHLGMPFNVVSLSLTPAPTVNSDMTSVLRLVNLRHTNTPNAATTLTLLGSRIGGNNVVTSSCINNLDNTFVPISRSRNVVGTMRTNTLAVRGLRTVAYIYSMNLSVVTVPNSATTAAVSNIVTSRTTVNVMGRGAATIHVVPIINVGIKSAMSFNNLLNCTPVVPIGRFDYSSFMGHMKHVPTPVRDFGGWSVWGFPCRLKRTSICRSYLPPPFLL